ncbi:MAG: hypothetical protein JRJ29_09975 [Deltaproteobacteria bacterium]|nr:hypothetical protein [Deltaproteobacteria bacterium]
MHLARHLSGRVDSLGPFCGALKYCELIGQVCRSLLFTPDASFKSGIAKVTGRNRKGAVKDFALE